MLSSATSRVIFFTTLTDWAPPTVKGVLHFEAAFEKALGAAEGGRKLESSVLLPVFLPVKLEA